MAEEKARACLRVRWIILAKTENHEPQRTRSITKGFICMHFLGVSFVPLVVNLFQVSRDLLVARYDKTSSAAYNVSWSSLVGACPQFPFPNPREDASIRGSVPGENLSRCEFVGFALRWCGV